MKYLMSKSSHSFPKRGVLIGITLLLVRIYNSVFKDVDYLNPRIIKYFEARSLPTNQASTNVELMRMLNYTAISVKAKVVY